MRFDHPAERYRLGTVDNAISKMINGYRHGLTAERNTCYAYVGAHLAKLDPPDATIRLWGIENSRGLMVSHGDAILPDGTVISDIPVSLYAKRGYHLLRTFPLDEFKRQAASQMTETLQSMNSIREWINVVELLSEPQLRTVFSLIRSKLR